MREMIIGVEFKDVKQYVEFDLYKNTIFYGFNGVGKTRILKLINSLPKLIDATSRMSKAEELFFDLNIKTLKINNQDFTKLFDDFESIKISRKKDYDEFYREYQSLILRYIDLLNDYNNIFGLNTRFSRNMIVHEKIRLSDISLNEEIKELKNIGENNILYENLLNVFTNIESKVKRNSYFYEDKNLYKINSNNIVQEIMDITNYFKNIVSTQKIDFDRRIDFDFSKRKQTVSTLSKITSTYYGNDSKEYLKMIEEERNKINNLIIDEFYQQNSSNNHSKLKKHTGYSTQGSIEYYKTFESKINKFNKHMIKYGQIQLEIEKNGDLNFYKKEGKLAFEKFSSGEKRLIGIYLTILFSNDKLILLDEPEISLSINFQSTIMNDLILLCENKILIVATHAPFIHKNFLEIEDSQSIKL